MWAKQWVKDEASGSAKESETVKVMASVSAAKQQAASL